MRLRRLGSALAALTLYAMAPAALAAATVHKVELSNPTSNSARIVLELSAIPARNVFTIDKTADKPERVVIDLPATRLASGLRLPKAAGPVLSLRSGTQPGKTLRLVVELSQKLEPEISIAGTRLTIELGTTPSKQVATAAAAEPPPPRAPVPVRVAHAPEDTGRDIIVAVDAGHGGTDPGALGAKGTREKVVTLAIARALAQLIDAEPGMKAYLVRDEDRKIELSERRERARRANADIFVSIHADSFKDRGVSGSSVYVLSERGASSEAARLLAEQENAVDEKDGEIDQMDSVLMDIGQSWSIGVSAEVAERALSHLDRIGTVRRTRVQRANFVVLRLPDIPSLLVETAYISNPAEEQKLRDPQHQKNIAEAIFKGVREYFRASPPDGTLFARQRDPAGVAPIMAGSTP
jgi:N-acetylmuramoyl-L-alanine amidase